MTIWYVDYEGGTDANASAGNGDSYATRRKKIDNVVAAALAPGDTIRVMGSPAPTSLGINGTWNEGPITANALIASSTNATPIVVTFSSAQYAILAPAVGSTVIVRGHTTNTKANGTWKVGAKDDGAYTITLVNADGTDSVGIGVGGATGTVRKVTGAAVILASALTQNIAVVGNQGVKGNWIGSSNVTCTVITTDFKEGGECQQIAVGASFATGMAAYYATGTLDLSAYQQVSFWIKQTAGTIGAAGACTLSLCSDTAGVTPVNTVNIPALGAINQWMPVSVDTGGALGNAIQSVALNVVTDNGAQTFLIDDIVACKASGSADSLTLTSLIGKNTASETWLGIQSINGTRVMLDAHTNMSPGASTGPACGYAGTSETVAAYKRETIKTAPAAISSDTVQTLQDSGTYGSVIAVEGGWDRTDMSAQSLETWFDGQNGLGGGIYSASKKFASFNKLCAVRYTNGLYWTLGNNLRLISGHFNNNQQFGFYANQPVKTQVDEIFACCNYNDGVQISICDNSVFNNVVAFGASGWAGSTGSGVNSSMKHGSINNVICKNNARFGVDFGNSAAQCLVKDLVTSGNAVGGVRNGGANNGGGYNHLVNPSIAEAVPVTTGLAFSNSSLSCQRYGGSATDHRVYTDGGLILSDVTTRHTASGYAWSMAVTSADRSVDYPLALQVAKIACAPDAEVTVSAWMRRSNIGLTVRLMCKGGQLAGVANDVSSSMTAAADTWEEVTIQFTPTEAGVVEITAEAYGGTTYTGYVDDLTISQA